MRCRNVKRIVKEVASFLSWILWQYDAISKVLILNWSFKSVVAEQPNPKKLSRVMEEY